MLKATENGEDPLMNLIKERFTKKRIVGWVSENSVRFVVVAAINNIVPADTKIKRVRRFIGAHVIADIVAQHAREWVDAKYDEEEAQKAGTPAPPMSEPTVVDGEVVSSSVVPYASNETPATPTQEHDGPESAQQQQHAAEAPTGADGAAESAASSPGTGDPAKDPVDAQSL